MLSTVSIGHLMFVYVLRHSFIVVLCTPSRRGIRQLSTAFMLSGVLILYASSVTHFGFALAYSVAYVRLLNNSVAALSATSTVDAGSVQLEHSARTTSYILSFVLAVNV